MRSGVNENLVFKIKDSIPRNVKPLPYLMNILGLSKESVYRRLRGEIDFSLDEISKLSLNLNFSIDELLGKDVADRIFFDLRTDNFSIPSELFIEVLSRYCEHITQLNFFENSEMIWAQNRLSIVQAIEYPMLFKFICYKWVHQLYDVPLNYSLSDLILPKEVAALCREIYNATPSVGNHIHILDQSMIIRIIKEIQYYCKRKLISETELKLLKKDLLNLVRNYEIETKSGVSPGGCNIQHYLSSFDIESNIHYIKFEEKSVLYCWVSPAIPFIIYNDKLCSFQKKWLDSLKKYSTLITQSNEFVQADFFNKQKLYIEAINMDIYNETDFFSEKSESVVFYH